MGNDIKWLEWERLNKWGKIVLFLFPIAIFTPMIFTNLLTIFLAMLIIVAAIYFKKDIIRVNSPIVFGFILFYLLILIGFFYDIENEWVFVDLEKRLSVLVLPLAISLVPLSQKSIYKIHQIYFWGSFLTVIISLVLSLWDYLGSGRPNMFSNHLLSGQLGLHATYFSLFLFYALSYPLFFVKWNQKTVLYNWLLALGIFMICFTIILLGVRIVWLILGLAWCFTIFKLLRKKRITQSKVLIFGLSTAIFLSLFFFKPVKDRFLEAINYNNEYSIEKVWGGRGMRLLIWKTAIESIEKSPFIGYGSSSSVQYELEKEYKEKKLGPLLYMMKRGEHFNAHNQYLEEVLKYGLILGLIYPLALLFLFVKSIKENLPVATFLVLVISLVSFTETIFELNKGIVFISFFVPLAFKKSTPTQIRKKIFYCFPISGPNNGVKVISQKILKVLKSKKEYQIQTLDTSQAGSFLGFGRFNVNKVIGSLNLILRIFGLDNGGYAYINLTPLGFAFYRDITIIFIFLMKSTNVTIHLHANGLHYNLNFITKSILSRVKIITINKLQHKMLYEKGLDNMVLPNSLPDFFEGKNPKLLHKEGEPLKLLMFSNLSRKKGIDRLITTANKMYEEKLPYEVTICGGTLDRETEKKLLDLCSKYNNITYLGAIGNFDKKIEVFSNNDFLLVLSDENYEVYPLVYIEALMSGMPILSTKQVISEDLENAGCLFTIKSLPEDIINVLEYYQHASDKEVLALKHRCRLHYENNYNFNQYVNKLYEIILL